MSSPYGQRCSPRCAHNLGAGEGAVADALQALEGKDVKDLLLNVGSGGGAAPAAGGAGGAAASGDAAAEEKAEEKEEGMSHTVAPFEDILTCAQRRRSPTRTWALVCSTKGLPSPRFLRHLPSRVEIGSAVRYALHTISWERDGSSTAREASRHTPVIMGIN
jgi:hypothetical protein